MKLTPERQGAFLTALAMTANVSKACKAVDIERQTAYEWRSEDPTFATAWEKAKGIGAEALEDEARRRAHDGFEETVYHQGVECGTITKYSDTLLIFLLKGAMPEKYRERIEHTGSIDIGSRILAARQRLGLTPELDAIDHDPGIGGQ